VGRRPRMVAKTFFFIIFVLHRIFRSLVDHRFRIPLHIIHSNVRQAPYNFARSFPYVVIFADDFSYFTWLYLRNVNVRPSKSSKNFKNLLKISFAVPSKKFSVMEDESLIILLYKNIVFNLVPILENLIPTLKCRMVWLNRKRRHILGKVRSFPMQSFFFCVTTEWRLLHSLLSIVYLHQFLKIKVLLKTIWSYF